MTISHSESQLSLVERLQGPDSSYAEIHVIPSQRVHIKHIWTTNSPLRKDHIGRGTALFKQIVERAMKENAQVTAILPGQSRAHLFFLKMGMVPDDFPLNYVALRYGSEGYDAINSLSTTTVKVAKLQEILRQEESRKNVTEEEVLERSAFLLGLSQKKVSFLEGYFAPRLSACLGTSPKPGFLPDSRDLPPCALHLSKKGLARWSLDLEHDLDFQPFRTFDQIKSNF